MADTLLARIPNTAITVRAGSGTIDVTSYLTQITNAGASAVTLGAGRTPGQRKRLQLTATGGDAVLSSTLLAGGTTITFSAVGDVAELLWDGALWRAISLSNVAGTAATPVLA
uniref:Uncharacterized protein n=1 Tax=Marseillevirus LCMAC103 TaxID=2506604 RepID=A0A481YW85_9VIRU|nr:MAG: hypothetical protein LCMAC103_03790 [Marseillevirus LCMAC103]